MKKNILMIMFDGFPVYRTNLYGGMIQTPNLEVLVEKSTFYSNVITAAPSTAMSLTSMFTGLYPHEFGRRSYSDVDSGLPPNTTSLFQDLEDIGYNTYVLWDKHMETGNPIKYRINVWQGSKTKFLHYNESFNNKYVSTLVDGIILNKTGQTGDMKEALSSLNDMKSPWAAFVRIGGQVSPYFRGASNNKTNYSGDDVVYEIDHVIKMLLDNFPDNTRFILCSDHGRMAGEQGILGYAFNLAEGTLKVPIIVYDPEIKNGEINEELISLINFKKIILNQPLRKTKYLYADSGYADQWHRKTMIRKNNWKYVFHRDGWPCKEQLFDLQTDPHELINLAEPHYEDPYRDQRPKGDTVDVNNSPSGENLNGNPLNKVLPRSDWKNIMNTLKELRIERKRIWEEQKVFE